MKVLFATVMVALLAAGPAYAQAQEPVQRAGEPDKEKSFQEKAAEKEAEKAYQRSLGNIPAKADNDPWGIARGDSGASKSAAKDSSKTPAKNPTKSAAKSAAPKPAKTGGTVN